MLRSLLWVQIACGLLSGVFAAAWSQGDGYRLRADRVEVRARSHWQAWKFPVDVVEISPTGAVGPRFVAAPTDAVLDAAEFTYALLPRLRSQYDNAFEGEDGLMARGGIKKAGSRAGRASRVMDGHMGTFWEPDPADPLENWWIEIDLGRLVSAEKVILRFAEDAEGERADPFLQFRIYSATGLNPFGQQDQSGALDYTLVGGTSRPNREQRFFEFDMEPLAKHTEEWTGRLLQYLRIAVTASRGDRAEPVTEEEYQNLSAADQGAIDYVWVIAAEERLVTPERYAELPAEQQGGVRHYRRERPRLAAVEVWTAGENIASRLIERGGSLHDVNPNSFPARAVDGSMRSDWFGLVYRTTGETAEWGLLTIDLGAQFWVDAVRFISRTLKRGGGENLLFGYQLRGSDGSLAPDGSLIWDMLSAEDRLQNLDKRLFEDRFETRKLRFLEFRNLDIARRTRAHLGDRVQSVVTEIQIFGRGYPPELTLTSDIIDLGAGKSLTTLEWEADTPPGTAAEIRTRTGDDLREVSHYFKKDGTPVATQEEYDGLPSFFKGEVVTEFLPGQGWSSWSQVYQRPGEVVRSPNPRRYMMIQARLLSEDPEKAASLRSIQVHFIDPIVDSVVGEIEPKREVPAGEKVNFELFIRPTYARRNPGIDRIRLLAPSRASIALRQVSMGREADFSTGNMDGFNRQADGRFENPAGEALEIEGESTDTLQIKLPGVMRRGGPELVRLAFSSMVFQSGSTFRVEVGNSAQPENWQKVDPGEAVADELGAGKGLTVLTPVRSRAVKAIDLPELFTPNGDGINDQAVFEFTVLKINVDREVSVELYDLAGRRLRRLAETRDLANGLYRIAWDGRDEKGDLVPPGLYLVRIGVASDGSGDNRIQQLVGVAY